MSAAGGGGSHKKPGFYLACLLAALVVIWSIYELLDWKNRHDFHTWLPEQDAVAAGKREQRDQRHQEFRKKSDEFGKKAASLSDREYARQWASTIAEHDNKVAITNNPRLGLCRVDGPYQEGITWVTTISDGCGAKEIIPRVISVTQAGIYKAEILKDGEPLARAVELQTGGQVADASIAKCENSVCRVYGSAFWKNPVSGPATLRLTKIN